MMVNYRNQNDPNSQGSEGQPTQGRVQRGMAPRSDLLRLVLDSSGVVIAYSSSTAHNTF